MADDFRQALEHRRAQRAQEITHRLLTEEGFDAVAATQELRAYDSLLSSLPVSKRQKIVVPLAIGLASITLAGILLTVPTGNNSIVFDINASAVGMTLDSMTALKPVEAIAAHHVDLSGLERLGAAPQLGSSFESTDAAGYLQIAAGRVSIPELVILNRDDAASTRPARERPPPQRLEVRRRAKDFFELTFRDTRVRMEASVSGTTRLVSASKPKQSPTVYESVLEIPEPIETVTSARGASPAVLRLGTTTPVRIHDVPVSDLSFSEHQTAATATAAFVSSVEGGTLTLTTVSRTVQLPPRAQLSLPGSAGRMTQLLLDDGVRMSFDGTVDRVRVNGNDVTPTWLEFLYASRPLTLLWSGALFSWGVLWSLKRLVG